MQIKRRRWFRYVKAYRFQSVFFRNLLSVIVLVSLPVVLMILLYSAHLHQRGENDLKAAHIETLSRTASVIDNVFSELESYTYMLSIDHRSKMFVFLEAEQLEKSSYVADIIQSISVFTGTFDYVESVYFYSEDNHLMINEKGLLPFSSMSDVSWFPAYQKMTGATVRIDARLKNDYYPYYLTLTYPILNSHKKEGAVIVNINIEKLARFADSSGDAELYLIDPSGHMLYASDVRRLASGKLPFPEDISAFQDHSSQIVDIEGQGKCYLSFIRSTQFDWNYILITPYSVYSDQTKDVFLLQIVLSTLLLSFIVSFVITELTYAPVRDLMLSLDDSNGSEMQYLDVQNKSEIAYIRNVVAKMRSRNDFLENELEQRMKALNDTQLVMLQSQINPHFIYNTLDTINWNVIERLGAPNDISEMLTTLASLLRISLSRESYLVSVAEEINHAKLYLALFEQRYRGRLLVFWDVDDTLLDCRILKLSLQPLIENALNHGLRSRRYNGEIHIGISSENGDTLVLSVEDNGAGMDEASLEKLRASLSGDCRDSSNVGIRNIQRRIRLLFGEPYGITLASPSQGLRVMIRCPIIRA